MASWPTSRSFDAAYSVRASTTRRFVAKASPRKADAWERQSSSSKVVSSVMVPVSRPEPSGLYTSTPMSFSRT